MKTYAVKASEIEHSWWVVDATGQTLGNWTDMWDMEQS